MPHLEDPEFKWTIQMHIIRKPRFPAVLPFAQ